MTLLTSHSRRRWSCASALQRQVDNGIDGAIDDAAKASAESGSRASQATFEAAARRQPPRRLRHRPRPSLQDVIPAAMTRSQRFRDCSLRASPRSCIRRARGRATTDAAAETGSAAGETELAGTPAATPNAARAGHARRKRRDQSSRNRQRDKRRRSQRSARSESDTTPHSPLHRLRSAAGAGRGDTTLVVTAPTTSPAFAASPARSQPEMAKPCRVRPAAEVRRCATPAASTSPKKRRRGSGR